MSLLLKLNPLIDSLFLYDRHHPPGSSVDLSHISTPCTVVGLRGESNIPTVLTGSDIVIVPAGVPRKPGMTRDDLFESNAKVGLEIATYCAEYCFSPITICRYCPDAVILLITNPVNSILPLFSEVYKKRGINGKRRLIGLSNLDSIRAISMLSHHLNVQPDHVLLPVIGGHSQSTIIPLFSQLSHHILAQIDIPYLTKKIQSAGDEVVQAKEGQGSATLAVAYAAATFTNSLLRAMNGEKDIVEPAYIEQDVRGVPFFSSLVKLGMYGIESPIPIPHKLTKLENHLLEDSLVVLKEEIQKGINFVNKEF